MTFRGIVLIIVFLLLLGLAFVCLTPAMSNVRELQDQLQVLQERHLEQQEEIAQLRRDIDALRSGNPQAVERIAREKFGYCRPGEEVFHFE